jgi:hypothetical protein
LLWYAASLPERLIRSFSAVVFGGVHETAHLVLPRLVRRSRLYEVTAKNLPRIAIELVGRVEAAAAGRRGAAGSGTVAVKKGVGNAVELGSIAAFGFSPLWLLAAASDVLNGTRAYLRALEDELRRAGVLAEGAHFGSVGDLLGALEGASGHSAALIDMPPLELRELRLSVRELRKDALSLPSPKELAALYAGLQRTARMEGRSLLEVSSGVGLAFLTSARNVGRDHLVVPYREDWRPLRDEGFGAYASRVSGPYRAAGGPLTRARPSWTETGFLRLRRWWRSGGRGAVERTCYPGKWARPLIVVGVIRQARRPSVWKRCTSNSGAHCGAPASRAWRRMKDMSPSDVTISQVPSPAMLRQSNSPVWALVSIWNATRAVGLRLCVSCGRELSGRRGRLRARGRTWGR